MGEFLALSPLSREWNAVIDSMEYDVRDIHFRPEFARVEEKRMPGMAYLAVYAGDGFTVCQPVMLRKFMSYYDSASIGFGGPITNAAIPSREHGEEFDRSLRRWYADMKVISEFTLFNPIFEAEQFYLSRAGIGETYLEKSVAVMLCDKREAMIERMRHGRRKNLTRDHGLFVDWVVGSAAESALGNMHKRWAKLYSATMESRGASRRWRDRVHHAPLLLPALGNRAMCLVVHDSVADYVAAIIMFGTSVAYYHLVGTADRPPQGAGELLVLAAAEAAAERGCRWLFLGGGVSAASDDTLLDFKMSFGSIKVPLYSRRRIIDANAYRSLSGSAETTFFPAYRSGEAT